MIIFPDHTRTYSGGHGQSPGRGENAALRLLQEDGVLYGIRVAVIVDCLLCAARHIEGQGER